MKKVENWQNKLIAWAVSQEGRPFISGETDCASLCKHGLEVIYGEDIVKLKWSTSEEALRTYVRVKDIYQYIVSQGWVEVERNYIQAGDLVILKTLPVNTFSLVVVGEKIILVDPKEGVVLRKLSDIKQEVVFYRRMC